MAILSRNKKQTAHGWEAKNKEREKENKKRAEDWEKKHKKEITPEEHEERIQKLKEAGVL